VDDEQAPRQSAATKAPSAGLKQGSLNLPRLAFIGLAYFSLALIVISLWQGGPSSAYAYLGEIFVFFVLLLYIFVNLANLVYHARFHRQEFNWFLNGFVPIAGIAIDGYVLYKGFFVSEISLPFKSGSSIVWFSLAWAVLGIGWALWWSRRRRLDSISLSAEV
jgi:amino acid transporter